MSLNLTQQLYETIQNSAEPLIVFGKDWNGDAIAASLALKSLLKKIGRPAEIVSPGFDLPYSYKFLPDSHSIKNSADNLKKFVISLNIKNQAQPKIDLRADNGRLDIHIQPNSADFSRGDIQIADHHYQHDLIIAINTPDLDSFDRLFHENTDFFYHVPIINIDHNPENEHYGHINFINMTASSISEMLYDFIEQTDAGLMDEQIATYLLTGMIEKTKSFKIPTVTPKSLNIASLLMAAGAERSAIIQNLYQRQTLGALRLWGRALLNLKTDDRQKIAWIEIPEKDFQETNSLPQDLNGVIDELITSIPTIEMAILFYEKNNEKICLIKSEKNLDLKNFFAAYSPSGNKNLISFKLDADPQTILDKLQQLL